MINLKDRASILRYKLWFERQMNILERKNIKAIKKVLQEQYEDAADYLKHGVGLESIQDAVNFTRKDLENAYTRLYQSTTEVFHKKSLNELKCSKYNLIELKTTEDEYWYYINKWIREKTAKKVVQVQNTTKQNIKTIVEKGLQDGLSNAEIAKEVSSLKEITTSFRAARIVRTEVHTAAVNAVNETMLDSGVMMLKSWSAANDERTREDHMAADSFYSNNPIPTEEAFVVGPDYLNFPGDPNGSAGNVINCRCVVLYETK